MLTRFEGTAWKGLPEAAPLPHGANDRIWVDVPRDNQKKPGTKKTKPGDGPKKKHHPLVEQVAEPVER